MQQSSCGTVHRKLLSMSSETFLYWQNFTLVYGLQPNASRVSTSVILAAKAVFDHGKLEESVHK